jgi:hypothetical protein
MEESVSLDRDQLMKKAAYLTVTGRYRESLNIMIYLRDRRERDKNLPLILPRQRGTNPKRTKC